SGFTQSLHGDVIRILEERYRVYAPWPDSPEQALAASRQAAQIGYDIVVAMGGDGTAHTVANGIHGSPTALSVIPSGTTNVLARLLGLGNRPRQAARAILTADGATRSFPTLRLDIEHPDGSARRIATFAAGIGYDADAISESERSPLGKVGMGSIHYARSALRVAARYRDRLPTLRVTDGETTSDAVGVIVQAHDELTYIGRRSIRLGPPPGPLALTVDRMRMGRAVSLAGLGFLRVRLDRLPGVRLWRDFTSIKVDAEPEALVEADGEVLGQAAAITITPEPAGLVVVDTAQKS
ncbi:MAG TPA: diacylglycerol kinase family protein, partial [Acidimicrobiia bacterium]|nr:diacylglycerol kinase family protein [Acidimicrobiia bacterium]